MVRVYLESLGCAKNQVDSETMLTYLERDGYAITDDLDSSDVIIINTCAFIESAKEESLNVFFDYRNRYPEKKIILSGCLSERYGKEMDLKEADGIFGNKDLSLIGSFVKSVVSDGENRVLIPDTYREESIYERDISLSYPGSRYLKLSEGCNHRCSYCAIPLIRGSLRSRDRDSIIREAKSMIEGGVYEINLIAQDLASYMTDKGEKDAFVDLIKDISDIDGDYVLRMLYIHPDDFPLSLIDTVKERKNILPYFDIPFQHSHESVLSKMGRRGNREVYLDLINTIREALPDSVIRSTLMIGFPTESDESIEDLKRFVEEAELDWMGSFIYSREEGTKAYRLTNGKKQLEMEKRARLWQKEIEEIQEKITQKRLKRFVGNTYKALIEDVIPSEGLVIGRIYSQAPDVDGLTVISSESAKPGDVISVKITGVNGIDLEGIEVV